MSRKTKWHPCFLPEDFRKRLERQIREGEEDRARVETRTESRDPAGKPPRSVEEKPDE